MSDPTGPGQPDGAALARRRHQGGARRKARRRAVDLIFEAETRGVDPVEIARERVAMSAHDTAVAPVNAYTLTLVEGVRDEGPRLDATLSEHLREWTLERLPAVDRAVLRVAVFELLHADEVPPAVVVDEAVELAKQLSTDDSPRFVNGVLGTLVALAPQVRAAAAATRGPGAAGTAPDPQD